MCLAATNGEMNADDVRAELSTSPSPLARDVTALVLDYLFHVAHKILVGENVFQEELGGPLPRLLRLDVGVPTEAFKRRSGCGGKLLQRLGVEFNAQAMWYDGDDWYDIVFLRACDVDSGVLRRLRAINYVSGVYRLPPEIFQPCTRIGPVCATHLYDMSLSELCAIRCGHVVSAPMA